MVLNLQTHPIREDMTFNNRTYRVIVYPASVTNPEPRMTVFFWNPEGKKLLLSERLNLPWETEDDLLQDGRTLAKRHAKNS